VRREAERPSPDREARVAALVEMLETRILVLDGAMGTALQAEGLAAADFGGAEFEGCNEHLCVTRPDIVRGVSERYLAAGADIVETNSFGSTPLVLAEYGLSESAFELSRLAASLAREACDRHSERDRPRFVCGTMGPTTKALSLTGGVSFEELIDHYRVQASGLMAGGADYLLLETSQDTRNVKAGLIAVERAFEEAGWRLPVAVSVTLEPAGTMLAGQDAEALVVSLQHADLLYLGLNCGTGPALMAEHLRTLSALARTRIACVPNAGLPDEEGRYHEGPGVFRELFSRFLAEGWLNLVGGCCGTTEVHVAALTELVRSHRPRRIPHHQRAFVSGIEAVELTPDNRPLLIGERTNVLGSRRFRDAIASGNYEEAAEIGRAQVRSGAQVLDICVQSTDRDESRDMDRLLERLTRVVKTPLMIDSTDPKLMARALIWCQGKSILNSINLEEGIDRFREVVPIGRRFGAAFVVGLIDERGMAVSLERKLEIARRSYTLLTEEYGVPPEDIWWDPLVFPCATGDETYLGSAASTIEAVRAVKVEFPLTRSVLGISNVSFGLPPVGREVVNSVFLFHATQAGLDAAIVNTERLARFAEIPAGDRALAEALIFLAPGDKAGGERAAAAFVERFRGRTPEPGGPAREQLPLEDRLARSIVEGTKAGLEENLAAALEDPAYPDPLAIVNGPLMRGMSEVGRLFNDNQLIIAEVLQSAEVMKAAVSFLESRMGKTGGASRGKVMLATVKGDVHDIGKNLVEIVLANNGFTVLNLGLKVSSERLIQAVREQVPDVIGLSGLLVKSAHQMAATAGDLAAVGIDTPLIVGGAALTRKFTHRNIAACYRGFCTYGRDAMHGLALVEQLVDPARRPALEAEVQRMLEDDRVQAEVSEELPPAVGKAPRPEPRRSLAVPRPVDLERHVAELDLDEVWTEMNLQMLYAKHLGLRGVVRRLAEEGDPRYRRLEKIVEELKDLARSGAMSARAVWRFHPAEADGNRVRLLDPHRRGVVAEWEFPRQASRDGLCLADYVLPEDHLALFVVTAGAGVRDRVEAWKQEGEFLRSHAFAALALETAEAAAEWLHRRLRADWGLADPPSLTLQDRLSARYRGKRYSFGYPACPDLAGQHQLFAVLDPGEIGVTLTEGNMMDPEASVSAIVVHHPDARYFGA
jgi:5-methyltetrahydrofolate--homocysteine methyltransferase